MPIIIYIKTLNVGDKPKLGSSAKLFYEETPPVRQSLIVLLELQVEPALYNGYLCLTVNQQ